MSTATNERTQLTDDEKKARALGLVTTDDESFNQKEPYKELNRMCLVALVLIFLGMAYAQLPMILVNPSLLDPKCPSIDVYAEIVKIGGTQLLEGVMAVCVVTSFLMLVVLGKRFSSAERKGILLRAINSTIAKEEGEVTGQLPEPSDESRAFFRGISHIGGTGVIAVNACLTSIALVAMSNAGALPIMFALVLATASALLMLAAMARLIGIVVFVSKYDTLTLVKERTASHDASPVTAS